MMTLHWHDPLPRRNTERRTIMTNQPKQVGGGRKMLGDFAPTLAELTDDVLFEDVWNRPELPARDRSLITMAVLTAGGNTDQLGFHLGRAIENGVTQEELIEAITHVTLYVGWPKGMAAMGVAKQLFTNKQ
jgi:4-carboxymuconolactone decarboxylase